MSDASIIRTLRERVDELEEENFQLRERLKMESWIAPRCLGLTKQERMLLGILMDVSEISTERLKFRLYGHEERTTQLVHVHVTHIRRKLEPYGITVTRIYGRGLMLGSHAKGVIRHLQSIQTDEERIH